MDANQRWTIAQAVSAIRVLAPYDPYWVEEPTSPDEILGLAAIRQAVSPVKIATGEHVANRVIFKQLLQAGALDFVQIDACRVAGVNENLAILLLAAKFGLPVCPHAGGVGLCEMVQHLAMFDFISKSPGTMTGGYLGTSTICTSTSRTRYRSPPAGTGRRRRRASRLRCGRTRCTTTSSPMARSGRRLRAAMMCSAAPANSAAPA